tara:strand:- start:289 stop:978 length:690 start_codon:yes stop_codon:yes gene_type:complete
MSRRSELPALDLLRSRRLELGLPVEPPPLRSLLRLWLPSGIAGLALVIVVVGLQVSNQMREQSLQAELAGLQPLEQQIKWLRSRLKSTDARLKILEKDTARIASQLVSIRSGSAFLEQLKRTTPAEVRLQSVTVLPDKVRVQGLAQADAGSDGLQRINAFMLNLNDLPAVPDEGARLQQANKESEQVVGFTLDVRVDPAVKPTAEQLIELGSVGMARRLMVLEELEMPL